MGASLAASGRAWRLLHCLGASDLVGSIWSTGGAPAGSGASGLVWVSVAKLGRLWPDVVPLT